MPHLGSTTRQRRLASIRPQPTSISAMPPRKAVKHTHERAATTTAPCRRRAAATAPAAREPDAIVSITSWRPSCGSSSSASPRKPPGRPLAGDGCICYQTWMDPESGLPVAAEHFRRLDRDAEPAAAEAISAAGTGTILSRSVALCGLGLRE